MVKRNENPIDLSLKFKLWISSGSGENIMGNGKWMLLKTINEEGSLKAATETLGISYRKAWGSLKKTESFLGVPLLDKQRGGKEGGRSYLTKEGKQLIEAYEKFYNECRNSMNKAFDEMMKSLRTS